jgi:hypothetical protein
MSLLFRNIQKRPAFTIIIFIALLSAWLAWQLWGIEAIWPPWEDETDFVLPGANWCRTGQFAIPQWPGFLGAQTVWRWHMPLFPVLMALWLKLFGVSLVSIRLFTLIPAACAIGLASEFCLRLSGWRSPAARWFWLLLLLSDKTLAISAVAGRMEIHALGFTLVSFAAALTLRGAGAFLVAGLCVGVGIGFHPFVAYFLPALCLLAITKLPAWPLRWRAILFGGLGVAVPCAAYAAWFLSERRAFVEQFLAVVRGTATTSLLQNCSRFGLSLIKFYLIQPTLPVAAVIALGFAILSLKRGDPRKRNGRIILVALIGYIAFLLRGSTWHYYYYTPLTIMLYFVCSAFLPELKLKYCNLGFALLAALLLNNIVFVGVKSWVVWSNRGNLNAGPMEAYLRDELKDAQKIVVPPNLWLFAFREKLDFRLVSTPIDGMPRQLWQQYYQRLLDWRPDVVIIDKGMRPSLKPQRLLDAGYRNAGHYERLFENPFSAHHKGYRLEIFRR